MHEVYVTLTDEDIEAAIIGYIQQKTGRIHEAQILITIGRSAKRGDGLGVKASVSGLVRDERP